MSRTITICDANGAAAPPPGVVGWDVGGANIKVARVTIGPALERTASLAVAVRPYELQRDPYALSRVLAELFERVGGTALDAHGVTMTAELSQYFRVKREGVGFVLDAVAEAFPAAEVRVYAARGDFLDPAAARSHPIAVAAANWAATGRLVGRLFHDAILIDVGTTTTDIIPIVGGQVRADGWTDPDRLRSGELVYLGAVRTPVEAIVHSVPLGDGHAGVSAEMFALSGDVHLWRGTLSSDAYSAPTPDGRPASREFARERLARVVCADRELLDDRALDRIADAVAEAQISRTVEAITRVRQRHPTLSTGVVAGAGDFLAASAAQGAGLRVRRLGDELGTDASRSAPAAAVALLLAETFGSSLSERRSHG